MSSGVTASTTDDRPQSHMNGVRSKPAPLSTAAHRSKSSKPAHDDPDVSSPISPTSPVSSRKPIKQRSASQSVGTSQINGGARTYRSASANPRGSSVSSSRKTLDQSTIPSRIQAKPSFQDIIKRFNDKPDEALPLPPSRSQSRSSSRCASPVRPGSAAATHAKRPPTSWKASGSTKPPSSRSTTTTPSKIPPSRTSRTDKDRRGSTSSTGSHSRGRRNSIKSVTDSGARAVTPAESTGTAPSDTDSKSSIRKTSIPKPSRGASTQSTPPISPISPVDTKRSRLPQSAGGRNSTTTAGSRSSLPKPINTKASTSGKTTTPQESPSLNAYIKAPESQKSPPLRSSRPRLPVGGATRNGASASTGMKAPSSSKANGRTNRTVSAAKEKEDSKPKKKIPELGTVDFAARRKMIASAFNDRMEKEREERNRAHQKKEREAAKKKQQQQEIEAKKAKDADTSEAAQIEDEGISPKSQAPVGLGLDLGNVLQESQPSVKENLDEAISGQKSSEFVEASPVSPENYERTQNTPGNETENSAQIPPNVSSSRPASVIETAPRSPIVPEKPEEYKRLSASPSAHYEGSTTSSRPSSRQMFLETEDHQPRSLRAESVPQISYEAPKESPRTTPTILVREDRQEEEEEAEEVVPDTSRDTSYYRKSLSPIQGSPSLKNDDWEKAVVEEKRRRREIEQDREIKLKNRLSTPVTPKSGSPVLDNDATPKGRSPSHKKQSSWSASPHLAPPDSLGQIMWKYRPLSTGGESMIDSFYKEQEDLSLARRRKQELMRFADPEPVEDYSEPTDSKGKGVQKYELQDKEYTLETEKDELLPGGYVHIEGTYRYSASTVNSSRSRSVDPNDYWTPQPSIGEFEQNPPRESWATDSTMTSYSTNSGLAPNGTFSRKIMDRERPLSDTPPTPPPKDFVFSPKHAPSTKSVDSDAMLSPPPNALADRRSSASTDTVEPLRIIKPSFTQNEVYQSPISINSVNSLTAGSHDDDVHGHSDRSPSSEYSEEDVSDRSSTQTPLFSGASPNPSSFTNSIISTGQEFQSSEKKLLTKRRFLLKELVDTEKTFFQDMTVTEEIYKGTAEACDDLKPEDIRILFGNTQSIVAFSRGFLETLKAAVSSVYVPAKAPKTPSVSQTELNDLSGEPELAEVNEEADFKTWVGDAFAQGLPNLEKVYGDYCKNHENAVNKLQALEKVRGVAIWLKECKLVADDLTNAWSLESLLIKPVQRLLKYPLLLDQILECTPATHPDHEAIELVAKEVRFVTERINESKKRKDLMDKLVGHRKKADSDLRHGLTKGWQRRAEKLRQSVGLSEMPHDERYEQTTGKFREQYFKLQCVMKDIEMYLNDVEKQIVEFGVLALRFEEFASCSPTTRFKEYEERWQTFTKRMKEIKEVNLLDHRIRIKRHVLTPLETALKMCDNPQKVMLKREKKAVDFARFRAMKEKGDRIDKKTKELADAYLAINDTLLDELPKLHKMIENLVTVVICNFAELCGVWEKYWASQLEGLLDPLDIPSNFSDITEVYKSDFNKVETVVSSLTITNTNSSLWRTYSVHSQASSSTNLETASTSSLSLYRSSTSGDAAATPSPNPSTFSRNSFSGSTTPNRLSGSFTGSALVAATLGPALPILPSAMQHAQSQRGRAASAVYTQPSRAPPPPPIRALSSSANLSALSPGISPTLSTHSAPPMSQPPTSHPSSIGHPSIGHPSIIAVQGMDGSGSPSPSRPSTSSDATGRTVNGHRVLWLCASIYPYHASKEADAKRLDGFVYLTYDQGEIFDVIDIKGEYWLAKNQDGGEEFGWIWSKHFAKLALD